MFPLTKRQLEQIRQYLCSYGVRDTDLPSTATVTTDDYIAIVKMPEKVNKKVKISDLFDPTLIPSLVVDIDVIDDWSQAAGPDASEKALSAHLGYTLYQAIQNINVPAVLDTLESTDTHSALSANMGRVLAGMITSRLNVIDNLYSTGQEAQTTPLSANMGNTLREWIESIKFVNKTGYYELTDGEGVKINLYTKAQIDALLENLDPSGSSSLAGLTDTNFNYTDTNVPVDGNVLKYVVSDNVGKWVPGVVSSTDTWRPIKVNAGSGNDFPSDKTLQLLGGTGISLVMDSANGTVTIVNTGGTGPTPTSGGYIGESAVMGSATPGQALNGIGILEIVGSTPTVPSTNVQRIYFGDVSASLTTPPYIELVIPQSGDPYFHFSHGIASDSFVSAGGVNGSSAPVVGALSDLSDVDITGTPTDGYVLTYVIPSGQSTGAWTPMPSTGTGGSLVAWGTETSDSVALSVDGVSKNVLTAHQSLSGYLTTSSSINWSKITGFPNKKITIGNVVYQPASGNDNQTVTLSNFSPANLTFGTSGNTYNATSAYTMVTADLTNIINSEVTPYIQIGQIKIQYDQSNNALKVIKADGTNANFYATGNLAAGA